MEKLKIHLCLVLVCFFMACSSSEPSSTQANTSRSSGSGFLNPLIQTNADDPTTTSGSSGRSNRTTSSASDSRYHVNNGKIYKDGEEIRLLGINWSGFEEGEYLVHNLWTRDYQDIIAQIKTLGFNAVRLPFCPGTLHGQDISSSFSTSSSSGGSINSALVGKDSLEAMDVIVEALHAAEVYILLDHHKYLCDYYTIPALWYGDLSVGSEDYSWDDDGFYSEDEWIDDLVFVAERYADLEYFMGIDLKNEPHEQFGADSTVGAVWGTGGANDWKRAAEEAADAVLAANDNILIFVEGVGGNAGHGCTDTLYNHNWGGNLDGMKCDALDIDASKLVLSPHIYGPDVYRQPYFSDASYPANLSTAWEDLFGYLSPDYSVVIGEFGGRYDSTDDIEWQDTMIDYMISKDLCSFFYWNLSPWSGDTGGILEGDWESVDEDKYANLCRLMSYCDASVSCE